MAYPTIYFRDCALEVTPSANVEDGDYPATNLTDQNPRTVYKPGTTGVTYINWSYSSAVKLIGFAVANHTLGTDGVTLTLRYYNGGYLTYKAHTFSSDDDAVILAAGARTDTEWQILYSGHNADTEVGALTLLGASTNEVATLDDGWLAWPIDFTSIHKTADIQTAGSAIFRQVWQGRQTVIRLIGESLKHGSVGDPGTEIWGGFNEHGYKAGWVTLDDYDSTPGTPAYYGLWDPALR
ncbi:MAG: hypothetical protein GF341_02785, partial [candidate division Zixibacteria bacterium]|nr:hypothetical protein [candidate division Zixibacteria bacterium]